MNRVRILNTHFDGGVPKYLAGQTYEANADTLRMVSLGHAVAVGVEVEDAPLQPAAVVSVTTQEPAAHDAPADDAVAQEAPTEPTKPRRGRPPRVATN